MAVQICDVGPRDGLQNESKTLEPVLRAELCDRLASAGLKRIEAASFVNPKLVPQMAGAEEVMYALRRKPGTVYAGLVLNEKGYERAVSAGVDEGHYAFSAGDEFGRRNQNATTEEGLKTALALVARARSDRVPVTVTISVAFGSPFDGPVAPQRVLGMVERLMAVPADEIHATLGAFLAEITQDAEMRPKAVDWLFSCKKGLLEKPSPASRSTNVVAAALAAAGVTDATLSA